MHLYIQKKFYESLTISPSPLQGWKKQKDEINAFDNQVIPRSFLICSYASFIFLNFS